ncbi:SDR family NAD(P)-dependent oxidoreductase [Spirosoma sp. KUDC1026]|uniref:SDR family NAD(P)-dependent oxidoreductase n=1 Tax=Spirosoma sp. KUDC1026 TaxID=2745947 RepID=UPI00159BA559|nr:SDR family NAD(P)-dependent oxidoreductase [Spirosoma sp. KUDC1026]QKZ13784.1 SDR family NAD(P)-dependent oxidoreductase [Spirosoma sp. KUDC1026]
MSKTIFITGASRGFGQLWTKAFLQQGYKVAATARNLTSLDELKAQYGDQLLPIQLDVTDRGAAIWAVQQAYKEFDRLDVLINNAGYGLFGSVEETSEQQARDLMETNFFGLLWLTQAVLPIMRKQSSGHIIQVSSVLGLITWPNVGLYNASKFAVEGLSETLASEVKGFGINVSLVEPGPYATDYAGSSAVITQPLSAYAPLKASLQANYATLSMGQPEATAAAVLQLIESEQPPLRLLLGKLAYPLVKQAYNSRFAEWDTWAEVTMAAHEG